MALRHLIAALATLDPESDFTCIVYVKTPGREPPVEFHREKKLKAPTSRFEKRISAEQLHRVRTLAESKKPAAIGREVGLHRTTVARYLSEEFKAGRMGRSGVGLVPIKGAYDLHTHEPVNPPVDKP